MGRFQAAVAFLALVAWAITTHMAHSTAERRTNARREKARWVFKISFMHSGAIALVLVRRPPPPRFHALSVLAFPTHAKNIIVGRIMELSARKLKIPVVARKYRRNGMAPAR